MRKDILTGWLLFLLSMRSSYGYELRREFGLRGLSLDPALMYRTLRDMESNGLITSRWVGSGEGPRRRVYEITAAGQAELPRAVSNVREVRDEYDALLAAYHERARAAQGESD